MKKLRSRRLLATLATTTVLFSLASPVEVHAQENLEELDKHLQEEFRDLVIREARGQRRLQTDVFTQKFEELFGPYADPDVRSGLDSAELRLLHSAADATTFYTQDPGVAELLAAISDELEQEDESGDKSHLAETYEELIEARLYVLAADFAKRHKKTVVPESFELVSAKTRYRGPSVIEVGDNQGMKTLARKPAGIAEGPRIIAIMHHGCAFSKQAVEHIEANEKLAGQFAGRTLWVMRQGATIPLDPIIEWNRNSELVDLVVSYKDSEWPEEILFTNTPVFYFLMDGEVVHRVMGWQGENTLSELAIGFEMLQGHAKETTSSSR